MIVESVYSIIPVCDCTMSAMTGVSSQALIEPQSGELFVTHTKLLLFYFPFEPNSSYGDYGLSSSESIDLTFHSVSTVTHNRLTVDTMAPTQMEPSHERRGYAAEEGDEEYFDRLDSKRY